MFRAHDLLDFLGACDEYTYLLCQPSEENFKHLYHRNPKTDSSNFSIHGVSYFFVCERKTFDFFIMYFFVVCPLSLITHIPANCSV